MKASPPLACAVDDCPDEVAAFLLTRNRSVPLCATCLEHMKQELESMGFTVCVSRVGAPLN